MVAFLKLLHTAGMEKQPGHDWRRRREQAYRMKKFAYYLLGLMTRLVFLLSCIVPEQVFVYCSRKGAALYMASSRRYKRRIAKNLQIAFGPSYTPEKVKAFIGEMGDHVGISVAEMFFSATPRLQDLLNRIRIHGKEHLEKVLALGKGVVAVSAHIGNFTLISVKMVEEGYPFIMLIKESQFEAVAKALRMLQDRQGGRFIYMSPWKEALRKILVCLRSNEIICLLADEKKRRTGIDVDIFGQSAATALGPAVLSQRTGSPVVPVFIVRQQDGTHDIFIEPPLDHHVTGARKEDERTLTAAYTKVIEEYVRTYPEQWSWINNRWRRKDAEPGVRV